MTFGIVIRDGAVPATEGQRTVSAWRLDPSLAAHRPLGSVMRARLQVYPALSAFRHRETGVAAADTARIDHVPA